jgi:hypothetical protein
MAGKLKPLDVARQVTPGKYPDGGGLYLIVAGPASRNWSYRYWTAGKERWHGLGSLKNVSLSKARLLRDAARIRVKGDRNTPGVDIVHEKRAARQEAKAEAEAAAPTFEECAQKYIDENWSKWSKKHRPQWPSSLKAYAYPTIGKLAVAEIKPSHIYELLLPIWLEKRETANRVRGRIETVIAKNVNIDDHDFRNPAELTKQLREKLPKRPRRAVRHYPALPYAEIPQFMTALSAAAGRAAMMLRFLIFTACRTNEIVEAGWQQAGRASWGANGLSLSQIDSPPGLSTGSSDDRRAVIRSGNKKPRTVPGLLSFSVSGELSTSRPPVCPNRTYGSLRSAQCHLGSLSKSFGQE